MFVFFHKGENVIDNLGKDNVKPLKYLEVVANGDNSIEEQIKARIVAGNRPLYIYNDFKK